MLSSLNVMNKCIFLIIFLIIFNNVVHAETLKTIHVEWEYGGIAKSFRLYQEGKLISESFDTENLKMDINVWLPDFGKVIFTMTAVNIDGETPHSAPFVLDIDKLNSIPTDPIPTDPIPTDPIPTDPIPTDPIPTDPIPTDPIPTDPIIISIELPIVILSITYIWDYSGDIPLGFRLYHNNIKIGEVGPDFREFTTTFQVSFSNENKFSVKVIDVNNNELELKNTLILPNYNLINNPKLYIK